MSFTNIDDFMIMCEKDEMLDMISKGMDDLKQMGLAINKVT
jgi:hypothetical protein